MRLLVLLTLIFTSPLRAATPLATGDTGMLDPGAWEFTVFATGSSSDAVNEYELPAVEVETGLTENTSISVEAARQIVDERGESSNSGWGNGAVAFKWRFYNDAGKALVFNPSYSHALSQSSTRRGLIDDGPSPSRSSAHSQGSLGSSPEAGSRLHRSTRSWID
jgi:hypothetical protein